ncbi:MAG: TetR/AcrR family transcriptional regulator [Chloroflexi bacterium]|nr:TetR/AcrR family transcriptional regulator [Chloroflexota bacterium]
MPRVTAAHGQEVRSRIVDAALRVFGELGYHHATIQDVVRASDLSVGAIYTYFSGKDELFLACCDVTAGEVTGALADRLTAGRSTADKLRIGVRFYLDTVDGAVGGSASASLLVHAWAEAEQEPAVREMLSRRREQLVTVTRMLLAEGVAGGEIPAWADIDALAVGYAAMLDGLSLIRIEAGPRYRRSDAERQAGAMIDLLIGAAGGPTPPAAGPVH